MNTIIIEVSGGCITSVTTKDEQVDVVIIDYDCQDAEDTIQIPDTKGGYSPAMVEHYIESPETLTRWCNEVLDVLTAEESRLTNPSEEVE